MTPNEHDSISPPRLTFFARCRRDLLAGVLVTAPLGITMYIGWLFIDYVDSTVKPLIPMAYNPETYLPYSIPGIGLLLLIFTLIVIGALAAGFMGRVFMRLSETVMARIPVLRSIYGALKQIMETILAQQSAAFRQVVLLEYPRKGLWALGFVTGETKGEVQVLTDNQVVNVFLPTTPNPTSGFLLFVPKEDVHVLHMTVEEGIKMVISGGIVTPDMLEKQRLAAAKQA